MSTFEPKQFELKKLGPVVGKQQFYCLVVDKINQYDDFFELIKDNSQYVSEHKTILTYMNLVSNLHGLLPKQKFREITPAKDKVKEYEFKSKHLRAYVFKMEKTGQIVAYWGFKNQQNEDIRKFRSIKALYLKQLK